MFFTAAGNGFAGVAVEYNFGLIHTGTDKGDAGFIYHHALVVFPRRDGDGPAALLRGGVNGFLYG